MHFIELTILSYILWLSPVFTCIRQNIKLSLSHGLLYSFTVFKYLILILRKENTGRIDLNFLGFGEKLTYFRALGSKGKILLGDEEITFRDLGRSKHYFQGSRENRTPWGLIIYLISILSKIVNASK